MTATATLRIQVEGGNDLRRVLGQIGNESRRAQGSLVRDAQASSAQFGAMERARLREAERGVRGRERLASEERRFAEGEARRREEFATRMERAQQSRLERQSKEFERAEQRRTKTAEREETARLRSAERAERAATRAAAREQDERVRGERRSARERERTLSEMASRLRSVLSAGGGAALGLASNLSQERQGARARRSGAEHDLNLALYQAGASATDAPALRDRVFQFARAEGISSAELGSALNTAQTEFSVLGNSRSSQSDRSTALENFLQTARFARNTGQDIGEVARVQGMLANSGLGAAQQRRTLLSLTGMAQRGAVELRAVSREAMAPMMARMHDARSRLLQRNPNATAQEIADEQAGAAQAAFAEIEVARGQGASPRRFARTMAQLGTEFQGSHRQEMILNNINNARDISDAQRTQLQAMFDHGQLRAQFQSGLGFASRVHEVLGGNESLMRNIFAGSGHGNAQSLQTNWRDAVAQMMGGGADVQRMLAGAGHDFTEADVTRGEGLFGTETKTISARDEETRDSALTENTGALGKLSDAFNSWVLRNPVANAALNAGANAAGGFAFSQLVKGAAPAAATVAAAPAAGALSRAALLARGALGTIGLWGGGALAAGLAGAALGNRVRQIGGADQRQGFSESVFSGDTWSRLWRGATGGVRDMRAGAEGGFKSNEVKTAVAEGVRQGLQGAQVSAQLDPQTAAHLAATQAMGANAPAPETRAR